MLWNAGKYIQCNPNPETKNHRVWKETLASWKPNATACDQWNYTVYKQASAHPSPVNKQCIEIDFREKNELIQFCHGQY